MRYKGILIYPNELDDYWLDRLEGTGINFLGIHPVGGNTQGKAVEDAIAELEQSEGPAIRSGVQGALAARGFPELGGSDELRDLYRQTVCDFEAVIDVFKHVQTEYGGDFDRAMDFLFSALSSDIAADVPSMGSRHLENVHDNLGKVRLTQSAFRLCEDVMNRWENVHACQHFADKQENEGHGNHVANHG